MKLAIYDFDGTIFKKETLPFMLKFWGKNKKSKYAMYKTYIKLTHLFIIYKLSSDQFMDKELFRKKASHIFLLMFKDMKKEELNTFYQACMSEMSIHFNADVLTSMALRKKEGYEIVVCSGAYSLLLEELKKYISIDRIIGTQLPFKDDNFIDYSQSITMITGENKPRELLKAYDKNTIDWQASCAYGDSYYDVGILELTGNPIAVNPDEKLLDIAKKRQWTLMTSD